MPEYLHTDPEAGVGVGIFFNADTNEAAHESVEAFLRDLLKGDGGELDYLLYRRLPDANPADYPPEDEGDAVYSFDCGEYQVINGNVFELVYRGTIEVESEEGEFGYDDVSLLHNDPVDIDENF